MGGHLIENAVAIKNSDSGKALLVEAPDFDKPEWIPHSQIRDESEVYKPGTSGNLVVTEWFAEQRGWV
jgi:hypothetical protein